MCCNCHEGHFHERHDFHGHEDCHRHGHEEFRGSDEEFGFRRHFVSNKEMLEALQRYLEELENEAQGVREAIAELKAEMETK
jgi:hypothetical protein